MRKGWIPLLVVFLLLGRGLMDPSLARTREAPGSGFQLGSPRVCLPVCHTPQIKESSVSPQRDGDRPFPGETGRNRKGKKCPPGFQYLPYNGERMCVRCRGGFRYREYNGVNMCVKCPGGYLYTRYKGRDMCVKCDRGFTYVDDLKGGACVKCAKGFVYKIKGGKGACRRM